MTPDDFQNLQDEVVRLRHLLNEVMRQLRDLWPIKPGADGGTEDFQVVYLYDDGTGVIGDRDTASTWAYDAKDASGATLATGLSPAMARSNGTTQVAPDGSKGIAVTIDGTLVLLIALGEYRGKVRCTAP